MTKTVFKIGDYVVTTASHKKGLKSNVIAKVVGISSRGATLSLSTEGIKQYIGYVCLAHPASMCEKTNMNPKQFFANQISYFTPYIPKYTKYIKKTNT
jgi:hypothetical protein